MVVVIDASAPGRVARFRPAWRKCMAMTRRPTSTIGAIGLQATNTIGYYDQLLAYREQPTPEGATRLAGEFETLFATVTGYQALDERITKTRAKKSCLLMVLVHPEIPLHNNPAELGARARVRKRDVSFGPRTCEGAKAWDTFMTLAETATKLGVHFYHSIHDAVSGAYRMSSVAALVAQ